MSTRELLRLAHVYMAGLPECIQPHRNCPVSQLYNTMTLTLHRNEVVRENCLSMRAGLQAGLHVWSHIMQNSST
jgi:hypothetical protein